MKENIIISTNGIRHRVSYRESKLWYMCNHAVGSHSRCKVVVGIVTCKNCLKNHRIRRRARK
jgi:hypothetical protein